MTSKWLIASVGALLTIGIVGFGCGSEEDTVEAEPVAVSEPETAVEPVPVQPEPEVEKREPKPVEAEPQATVPEKAVDHRWAAGKQGVLLKGLDDGLYEPYAFGLVKEVQEALIDRGLYSGNVHGFLDEKTMDALGKFQAESNLAVSGVPTPRTRTILLAGKDLT